MKRKVFAVLFAASIASGLVAGCGNGAAEEGAGSQEASQGTDGEAKADADGALDTDGGGAEDEEDLAEITVSFWSLAGVPTFPMGQWPTALLTGRILTWSSRQQLCRAIIV